MIQPRWRRLAPRAPLLAVLLVFAAHAAGTLWWTLHNGLSRGPQNEFHHLWAAIQTNLCLAELDTDCLHTWLIADYHPGLPRLVGGLFLFLVPGGQEDALVLSNLLWLAALAWGCWDLGRQLAPPGAPARQGGWLSACAAILAISYPGVVGSVHYFELNVALMGCTALALAWIGRAALSPRRWLLAGLGCALALLTDRFTAGPFVGGAAALALARPLLTGRTSGGPAPRRRTLLCALACCVAPLVLLLPWFLNFLEVYLSELMGQFAGEVTFSGRQTETRAYGDLSNWIWYPLSLALDIQGLLPALASAFALPWFLRRARGQAARATVGALAGVLAFTFVLKKQPFYILPVVPALAVISAWGLMQLRPRIRLAAAGLLGLALLQLGWMATTSRPLLPATGPLALLALDQDVPEGSWQLSSQLPRSWVQPRHRLSGRPDRYQVGLSGLTAAMRSHGWSPDQAVVSFADSYQMSGEYLYPMTLLRLRSRNVAELMTEQERFLALSREARWFIYVSDRDQRPFPTRASLATQLRERGLSQHEATLWRALSSIEERRLGALGWNQGEGDTLYLFPLSAGPSIPAGPAN